ncbi:MAG: hypothetical protein GC164_11540 [Phycisphaera sp.]|nr:hypothetical protein [Phycisphaera sp.]
MIDSDYFRRPDAKGHLKVLEVLRRWDPIGVISEHNQDEYDMYSTHIVQMLDAGASVEDLLKHMRWIVTERMEIGFDAMHSRSCAEELVEFWRSWRGS